MLQHSSLVDAGLGENTATWHEGYWMTQIKRARNSLKHYQPKSYIWFNQRAWVRHCIKQVREWRATASVRETASV